MRQLVVGLVVAIGSATVASAATYRIDVTGEASAVYSAGPLRDLAISDDLTNTENIIAARWTLDSSEIPLDQQEPLTLATSGRAFFAGNSYFDCTGLLEPLCWAPAQGPQSFDAQANTFNAVVSLLGYGADARANERGLSAGIERAPTFQIGSLLYVGNFSGDGFMGVSATFSSTQVSVIPLPASSALLFAALAAFFGFRQPRKTSLSD